MKTANPRTDLRVVAALFLGLAAAGIASPLTGQPLGGIGVGVFVAIGVWALTGLGGN